MEIRLAKSAGFCFGVKRAVEQVYKEAENGKDIYTYGPIIHNEEVVKDLEEKGVFVIDSAQLAQTAAGIQHSFAEGGFSRVDMGKDSYDCFFHCRSVSIT